MAKNWSVKLNTGRIKRKTRDGAGRGLYLAAEHGLAEAKRRVPIEEGTLERSGTASVDEAEMKAAVSFDTPYAVVQHEDLTMRHDDGRQAKYLENALNDNREEFLRIFAQQLGRALGR